MRVPSFALFSTPGSRTSQHKFQRFLGLRVASPSLANTLSSDRRWEKVEVTRAQVLRLAGLVPNRSGRHRSRSPDRKPVRKVLLYGPSATGKTCLTSAIVARCADATVYYVSTPVLLHRRVQPPLFPLFF
ncbi:hypothetical protein HPB48_022058 [Haemaphysalis longicornis]|uniref:Uncharacterized protein n=1 Tax=Haemaphysalis longicornis TaxID=44386 RepID=A0A9J6GVV5_HAELO|nr:hypothetical protein HPB48_022058 [Haemaphysalis longicornis]